MKLKGTVGIIMAPSGKGKSYIKESNERAIKKAKELGYTINTKK